MAETTFTLDIIVDPSGAVRSVKRVGDAVGRVQGRVDKLRKLIQRAFIFIGISVGIRQLVKLADVFLKVQNRLRVVTEGQAQLADVTEKLFGIARRTRSEFAATAELYTRLAINSRELGRSQGELLQFTESLNQAIIISGASAKEANSGLIQLSQGLASGVLRGDELRSVLEQLPTVADVISNSLGITRGQLREFGTEGKITADIVINAFLEAREELEDRFAKTLPTVAQAFTILKNSALRFTGQIETSSGVTARFARLILVLADNFDVVARAAIAAGIAISTVFVKRGIASAITGIRALTVAILANPFGAILGAVIAVTSVLIAFSDQISFGGDSLANLQDVAVATFDVISETIAATVQFFQDNWGVISFIAKEVFGDIEVTFRDVFLVAAVVVDTLIGIWVGGLKAIVAFWKGFPNSIGDIVISVVNLTIRSVNTMINFIAAAVFTTRDVTADVFSSLGDAFVKFAGAASAALKGNFSEAARLASEAKDAVTSTFADVGEVFSKNFKVAQETVLIPEVENAFAGGAVELRDTVIAAMQDGLTFSGAQELAADIIGRAEAIAAERIRSGGFGGSAEDGAPGGGNVPEPDSGVAEKLLALQQEKMLLEQVLDLSRQSVEAGKVRAEAGAIELEFRKKGVELTEGELRQLTAVVTGTRKLKEEAALLAEIRGPSEEFVTKMETLNRLFSGENPISIQEYNDKLLELEIAAAQADKSISGGLNLGLLKVKETMSDVAGAASNALTNAFNSAEDALVEFVKTGTVDFKQFALNIIADITRIIAKLLIMKAIEALGGGFGAAGSAAAGAAGAEGNAEGGPVSANKTILVGEEGPELFQPSTSGQVVPNDATTAALGTAQKQKAPVINITTPPAAVQVVNVSDPDEITGAIESPDGEQAIINVIQRNSASIRRTLA